MPVALGFLILFGVRWQLNVLSFGEEEARSMGIKTARVRHQVIIASTLITAACVSICGMVGWVGLVIPHAGRALVGPNFKRLLPHLCHFRLHLSAFGGRVARTAFTVELPTVF